MGETHPSWSVDALHDTGDIVIVGAGLAGLYAALKLSPLTVTVVAAAPLGEGASSVWAQGGMAAAVSEGDTAEAHALDTISSGAGLVNENLALSVAKEAPDRIHDLITLGVPFDKDSSKNLRVSKEAAHSQGRVVRVSGDRAGGAIMSAVISAVKKTPSIRLLEGYRAENIITDNGHVTGLQLAGTNGKHYRLRAKAIVLATGGIGGLFKISTNPYYARGEAIAMAARAGAVISDAEFVQFHPTALDINQNPAPLATEALRGEGATLVNQTGKRFLLDYDPRAELASRDIVAHAVAEQIAAGNKVFLDCCQAIGDRFKKDFPTVYTHCVNANIDPARDLIPVAPAAHYHMGGIATDACGRTNVAGLWAIGETAATGLHGGNRLASNSLLEAVVFAARAATDIDKIFGEETMGSGSVPEQLTQLDTIPTTTAAQEKQATHNNLLERLRQTMSQYVGVVRNGGELRQALATLVDIEATARRTHDNILANMALAARFIATAAYLREESRGAHMRGDFPKLNPALGKRSMLTLADIDAVISKEFA